MKTQTQCLSNDRRKQKRTTNHPESLLQRSCVEWFQWKHYKLNGLLFAVPNGGKRGKLEASIMKGEGVVSGVADLLLFVPNKEHHALCIEMKTQRGTQSDSQKLWQEKVTKQGYRYEVCKSREQFIQLVDEYLANT